MATTLTPRSVIDHKSEIALLESVDLFKSPPTQVLTERQYYTTHYPLSTLTARDQIQFNFRTSPDEYTDLSKTFLKLRLRVKLTSTALTTPLTSAQTEKISLINYPIESLFQQKDLIINNKKLTSSHTLNGYRSAIDTEFWFTPRAKSTWLQAAHYNKDNYKHTSNTHENGYIKMGKELEITGVPHFDLTFQERLLIGGLNVNMNFTPHTPEFFLKVDDDVKNYKVEVSFTHAELQVCRYKITDLLFEAHQQAMLYQPVKYPITRVDLKTFTIPVGSSTFTQENMYSGFLPNKIFLCFVDNDAFKGTFLKDPFNFGHFNIDYIALVTSNGTHPANGYKLDFAKGQIQDAYLGLFTTVGQLTDEPRISITEDQFKNGKTIFPFSLAPGGEEGCTYNRYAHPKIEGNVRLQVHFDKALPSTIVMVAYAMFDNMIYIDKDYQVTTDFQ